MAHLPSMERCKTFKIKKNTPEIIKVTIKLKLLFTSVLRSELVRGHTITDKIYGDKTEKKNKLEETGENVGKVFFQVIYKQ